MVVRHEMIPTDGFGQDKSSRIGGTVYYNVSGAAGRGAGRVAPACSGLMGCDGMGFTALAHTEEIQEILSALIESGNIVNANASFNNGCYLADMTTPIGDDDVPVKGVDPDKIVKAILADRTDDGDMLEVHVGWKRATVDEDDVALSQALERIYALFAERAEADEWMATKPLAPFGGMTPQELLNAGRPDAVMRYIENVMMGGFQ